MTDHTGRDAVLHALAAYGSDLSRWPDGRARPARAALLGDTAVRRAWDDERAFDRELASCRQALDGEIAASGAVERVRRRALSRLPAAAHLPWREIAAAMLVAGMLGSAMDFMLAGARTVDPAAADPLFTLDDTTLQ
jgi:hypothetical protein